MPLHSTHVKSCQVCYMHVHHQPKDVTTLLQSNKGLSRDQPCLCPKRHRSPPMGVAGPSAVPNGTLQRTKPNSGVALAGATQPSIGVNLCQA